MMAGFALARKLRAGVNPEEDHQTSGADVGAPTVQNSGVDRYPTLYPSLWGNKRVRQRLELQCGLRGIEKWTGKKTVSVKKFLEIEEEEVCGSWWVP